MNDDKCGFYDYGALCLEEDCLLEEWLDCWVESDTSKELRAQAKQRLIRASDAYDKHAEFMEEAEATLFDEAFEVHANLKGKHIATLAGKRKHSRDRRGTRKAQAENHLTKTDGRKYRDGVRKKVANREFRLDMMSPGYVYDNHDEHCDGVTRDNSLERWDYRAYQEEIMRALHWHCGDDLDDWDVPDFWSEDDPDEFDRRDDPAMTMYLEDPAQKEPIAHYMADRLSNRFGEQSVEAFMRFYQEAVPSGMKLHDFIYQLGGACRMAQEDYWSKQYG